LNDSLKRIDSSAKDSIPLALPQNLLKESIQESRVPRLVPPLVTTEVAEQATEVANLAREAADGAKEMTTCQFPPYIFHPLTSPPNIRGSGNGRIHLARGKARQSGTKKERKKERKVRVRIFLFLFLVQIHLLAT
jgi:histone H3/H4